MEELKKHLLIQNLKKKQGLHTVLKLQALRAQMVEQTNCQVSHIRSITEYEVPFKIQEMLNIVMKFNI